MATKKQVEFKLNGDVDTEEEANVKLLKRNSELNPYSAKYRILKTVLMCFAWISFGMNQELARITLEDLRILLDTNYQGVSFTLLMRFAGAMLIVIFAACIMDKFVRYTELLMAFGKLLMALPNLFIPHVRIYWLSTTLFFIQGIGIGIYDIGGNQIILRLWSGISNSPVNAMHSGYGIGAIVAVQILKMYIKFDPLSKLSSLPAPSENNTQTTTNYTMTTSSDIDLVVPYTTAGLFGIIIVITFIVAQFFEWKALRKYQERNVKDQTCTLKDDSGVQYETGVSNSAIGSIQKLIFGRKFTDLTSFFVTTSLTILLFLLFMLSNGTITVLNTFMLTYLTRGPAKFKVAAFIKIQTLYWIFFISGRLAAAFVGFKMNSLIFFLILISTELFFTILYCIPFFNTNQAVYWFLVPILGTLFGPLIPSCFMIPKYLFKNLNAFLLSIFFIGIGLGNIASQYITALVLDAFNEINNNNSTLILLKFYSQPTSAYLIPYILVSLLALCSILFSIILFVYKNFRKKIF